MITIEETPKHVLALRLSGVVEKNEIQQLAKAFEEKFAENERVNIVVDMSQWSDITADAIAADMKFELGQLDKVSRISRMAIVSDKQFVQAIMKFMRPLVPTVEIKTFGAEEYDKALAFASEKLALKPEDKPAMRMIETNNPKIIGYEIDGTLTEADIDKVMPLLQKAFEKEDKIDLFARMKNFGGFDPAILADKALFSMKFSAIGHIRRYAIVGAPGWMRKAAGMMSAMLPIAMRFFDTDQEDEAWAWLKA